MQLVFEICFQWLFAVCAWQEQRPRLAQKVGFERLGSTKKLYIPTCFCKDAEPFCGSAKSKTKNLMLMGFLKSTPGLRAIHAVFN